MTKYFIISLFICLFLLSCKSSNDSSKCLTGEPRAIFDKNMQIVSSHNFTKNGQQSSEQIGMKNGVNLEIFQQGCDTLFQSFRFHYPNKIAQDSFKVSIDSAINQFKYLSYSEEQLKPFSLWSNALTQVKDQLIQGEYSNLGNGVSLKIDKIEQADGSNIIIDVRQIAHKK